MFLSEYNPEIIYSIVINGLFLLNYGINLEEISLKILDIDILTLI